MPWTAAGMLLLVVTRGDRSLSVTVVAKPPGWLVVSVETRHDPETIEDVFDDHAHKTVGMYGELARALEAGESFARHWLKGTKSTELRDACECGEIR